MRIAVAGGTGTVGAHVVRIAEASGHEVRVLSRASGVDLVGGEGIDLTGVDVVLDVTGPATASASKSTAFFETVTAGLLRAERQAGVGHHLALSIVGAAGVPFGYYAGKARQERLVAEAEVPWTILRTTQFFEFAERNAVRLGPWAVLPAMRSRPLAAETAAERLVRLAEAGPSGDARDLAGPEEIRMAQLARAVFAHRGERRRVLEVPLPGGFGRALRDGDVLPGPDAEFAGPTLEQWLSAR